MEEISNFQYKIYGSSKSSRPGSHKSSKRGSGMELTGWLPYNNTRPRRLDLRASIIDPYERWLVREFKQRSAVSVFAIVTYLLLLALMASKWEKSNKENINIGYELYDDMVIVLDLLASIMKSGEIGSYLQRSASH